MSRGSKILLVAAALLAGLYLFWPEQFAFPLHAMIKTAPIWLLAVIAWREAPQIYRMPLALALVFCGLGDFALASPFALSFPAGMAAFLVGHLFYLWIFSRSLRRWADLDHSRRLIIFLIAIYTMVMGVIVLPHTGVLLPAITVYFAVLALMAAASFASLAPRWTRIGALLFVLSDSLIGIDKFLAPLEFRHISVMSSYYAAQVLILAGLCWQARKQ